ncbi:unnamed protein product [Prunus armeniaca]
MCSLFPAFLIRRWVFMLFSEILGCIEKFKLFPFQTSERVRDFLSARSTDQVAEIQKLNAVVQDLKESESELKMILEMYRHELTDPRYAVEFPIIIHKEIFEVSCLFISNYVMLASVEQCHNSIVIVTFYIFVFSFF